MQSDYHVRWSTGLADGSIDEAIADTSLSRWVNYYVEGLQWLSQDHSLNSSSSSSDGNSQQLLSPFGGESVLFFFESSVAAVSANQRNATSCLHRVVSGTSAIDGVYLDEVSFDRSTVQRMRKAVDRYKSGNLFDLHSCNKFHCGVPVRVTTRTRATVCTVPTSHTPHIETSSCTMLSINRVDVPFAHFFLFFVIFVSGGTPRMQRAHLHGALRLFGFSLVRRGI